MREGQNEGWVVLVEWTTIEDEQTRLAKPARRKPRVTPQSLSDIFASVVLFTPPVLRCMIRGFRCKPMDQVLPILEIQAEGRNHVSQKQVLDACRHHGRSPDAGFGTRAATLHEMGVRIEGVVTDPTGALISGAQITAADGEQTTTDAAGRFVLTVRSARVDHRHRAS